VQLEHARHLPLGLPARARQRHRHGGADRKGRIRYCRGCPRVA
jgi:hypothetical protein